MGFAANDTGVSLGAAFFPFYEKKRFRANTITPYLGPSFSDGEILEALRARSDEITFRELEEHELLEEAAAMLADSRRSTRKIKGASALSVSRDQRGSEKNCPMVGFDLFTFLFSFQCFNAFE